MSKVRMKCAHCGKHFKSSSAKQTLCPDCEARERRQRTAAKVSGAAATNPLATAPTTPVKIVGPAASILVPGMAPAPVEPEVTSVEVESTRPHAKEAARASAPPDGVATKGKPKTAKAPQQRTPKPKQPREPKPLTPAFEVTDAIRAKVEARYLELAQPVEFDGIRTQIAGEMTIPKVAVKKVIRELRDRVHMPSWWDLRAFTGSDEDLERIRAAYVPLLPIPDVGVHKLIAEQFGLSPLMVYQGIRRIRAEMRLPQYNPPELHGDLPGPATDQPAAEHASASSASTAP
jgi:hypothetical protein